MSEIDNRKPASPKQIESRKANFKICAEENKTALMRHYQEQLDAEADRLWDEGILNQERLDEIRQEDLHTK